MNELTLVQKECYLQVRVKAFPCSMEKFVVLRCSHHVYVGNGLPIIGLPGWFACSCGCLRIVGGKISIIVVLSLVSHCTVMCKISFPFIPVMSSFIVRMLSVEGSLFCTVMDISGRKIA